MKNILLGSLLIIAAIFASLSLNGQVDNSISLYYGGHYFVPSDGYAHSVGIQRDIINTKFGILNGEASLLFGGQYGPDPIFLDDINPNTIVHAAIGPNLVIPLGRKESSKLSLGLSVGISAYSFRLVETFPVLVGGTIISGFTETKYDRLLAASIRYIQDIELKSTTLSIIPHINIYDSSIFAQSAGLMIAVRL